MIKSETSAFSPLPLHCQTLHHDSRGQISHILIFCGPLAQVIQNRCSMTVTAVSSVEKASASGSAEKPISRAKIQGRTAVITGGSQGVGKALAKKFAEAGFNVVIAARQADRWDAPMSTSHLLFRALIAKPRQQLS